MTEYIDLLRLFSEKPITVSSIQQDHNIDIGSKEFIELFLYLKSENLIRPLSGEQYGLSLFSNGSVTWREVNLVITKEGKKLLASKKNPITQTLLTLTKNPTSSAIIVAMVLFLAAFLATFVGIPPTSTQQEKQLQTNTNVPLSLEAPAKIKD